MRLTPVRLLLAFNLILVAGLAYLWFDGNGRWRNVMWQAPAVMLPDTTALANLKQSSVQAVNPLQNLTILERPVFAPDRKPPPQPKPPPPPDPMANIQLTGIFSGADGGILARVEGKSRRIKVNDVIGAWTLKSVEGRSATFANGTETRQLQLAFSRFGTPPVQTNPGGPGQAPAAAAGGQSMQPNAFDEARERLQRANAVRAAHGVPVLNE